MPAARKGGVACLSRTSTCRGAGPSEDFGRTPPQDIAAEQSVLGGMMLSKDAIADVVEVLRGKDFYRPAHETVFEAITDLYGRGEPADAVTVAAELTKRGELGRIGGPAYLHTLHLVGADGGQRRLLRAGSSTSGRSCAGWSPPAPRSSSSATPPDGGDVEEIVNAAQAEIYAGHRAPDQRGLPAARRRSSRARSTRSRPPATAATA